jgi:hypothetical protein
VGDTDPVFDDDPATRLRAARALSRRARRRLLADVPRWPDHSPGARNAWLLLVTTKPPTWADALHPWPDGPLTLGELHDGFAYPDPIGFWAEVRRWSIELFRARQPAWSTAESLALTALVHVGGDAGHLRTARDLCRPRMVVFLDDPAWQASGLDVPATPLAIPDPHRPGQQYVGWWGTTADGVVVGKAPQHPTMHRLYDAGQLSGWLRAAPHPDLRSGAD